MALEYTTPFPLFEVRLADGDSASVVCFAADDVIEDAVCGADVVRPERRRRRRRRREPMSFGHYQVEPDGLAGALLSARTEPLRLSQVASIARIPRHSENRALKKHKPQELR